MSHKVIKCNSILSLFEFFKGALVIDRVSIVHITAVQRLTGAVLLSTFTMDIPVSNFGQLERIEHMVLNNKRSV